VAPAFDGPPPFDAPPFDAVVFDLDGTLANTFKIIMLGSQFYFYLNDEYIGSVTDTAISSGRVTVRARLDEAVIRPACRRRERACQWSMLRAGCSTTQVVACAVVMP